MKLSKDLDLTKAFYRFLFPDLDIITKEVNVDYVEEINPILFKFIVLYGNMASGKTETVRRIVEEAISKYGVNNVNATVQEDGYLYNIIKYGLTSKLINILFVDNITLVKQSNATLKNFFNIRHILKDNYDINHGYILGILGCHRFHGVTTELRTSLDAIIIRNSTLNPYDKNVLTKFTSKELMRLIEKIEENRLGIDELMELSIFSTKTFRGILKTPLSTHNYLTKCYDPISAYGIG